MSLVTLGESARKRLDGDVVALLLDCHERIRRFSGLATHLSSADRPAAEIREAAEELHRYFTLAFPLHVVDEEQSLRPRLLRHPLEPDVASALETMSAEHVTGETLLEPLVAAWGELARHPSRDDIRAATLGGANRFRALLLDHLAVEESTLFPVIAERFSPAEVSDVLREMRLRRAR
jgi:hemerythrin-like domain-containing protein